MTSYDVAYDRLRSGIVAANLGFINATTAKTGTEFLALYHKLDDELDAIVAKQLMKSGTPYKILTDGLKGAKQDLEDILDDIQDLVKGAEVALKIATILAKIVAIL
jgi:hypothetical protein